MQQTHRKPNIFTYLTSYKHSRGEGSWIWRSSDIVWKAMVITMVLFINNPKGKKLRRIWHWLEIVKDVLGDGSQGLWIKYILGLRDKKRT